MYRGSVSRDEGNSIFQPVNHCAPDRPRDHHLTLRVGRRPGRALQEPLPIFNDPVVFRELFENKIGVGACSKAVLSRKNQYIPVQSIDILANWHAISVRSEVFEASRSNVCNQCVIIRAFDTDRKILVASAGDCINCEEN
ncbi:hypothetical protein BGZ90_004837 [Linnemannia elongata]|nr:hypothetical protein BGZ90_004837 [Linnemannia elongata]